MSIRYLVGSRRITLPRYISPITESQAGLKARIKMTRVQLKSSKKFIYWAHDAETWAVILRVPLGRSLNNLLECFMYSESSEQTRMKYRETGCRRPDLEL